MSLVQLNSEDFAKQKSYYAKYTALNAEVEKLAMQKSQLEHSQQLLSVSILEQKNWIAKQPQMLDFIEKLQHYIQQKNILSFNDMLSAFVADVLQKDKKRIELELYTSHNLPALKLHAMNEGKPESIMDGSGGSIANIVSAGLRIIACARSNGRKFLVLDEADCWVKPDRVPLFANVIGEISQKLGIQILMISHHGASYFSKWGRVIEIKKEGGRLESQVVSDTTFELDQGGGSYVKNIKLEDFMAHHLTSIDLHPNVTCIIGDNDIGKSAITAAARALIRNQSEDAFVKHDCDSAKVWLTLSDNSSILWQRNKKTTQENKQKVYYELLKDDQVVLKEFSSYEVPEQIKHVLNMPMVDDIDIHISHQKEPTFLIDSKTRPQDKAKILSLGKESIIIQKMMEKLKEKSKHVKQNLKAQESQYHENSRLLQELAVVDVMRRRLATVYALVEAAGEQTKELVNAYSFTKEYMLLSEAGALCTINSWQADESWSETGEISSLCRQMNTFYLSQNLHPCGEVIANEDMSVAVKAESIYNKMSLLSLSVDVKEIAPLEHKQLEDVGEVERVLSQMACLEQVMKLKSVGSLQIQEQNLSQVQLLQNLLSSLQQESLKMTQLNEKKENADKWFEQLEAEQLELVKKMGGVCPTCHQSVNKEHLFNH